MHQAVKLSKVLAASLLLATVGGCGAQQSAVGTKFIKSQAILAAQGGNVTVTAIDDPALTGLQVQIPARALAVDTTITVAEGLPLDDTQLAGATLAGTTAQLGPDGTRFATPATLTLPFVAAGDFEVSVIGVEADGTLVAIDDSSLAIDTARSTVSFPANGFTRFAPVHRHRHPDAGGCPPPRIDCCGICLPLGSEIACPVLCTLDGGAGGPDAGGFDAGSTCPPGETECCGVCFSEGDAGVCPALCSADAGSGGTSGGSGGGPGGGDDAGFGGTSGGSGGGPGGGDDAGFGGTSGGSGGGPDAGSGGGDAGFDCSGELPCCDGTCPFVDGDAGAVCPSFCKGDGGGQPFDAGQACPGEFQCCDGSCVFFDDAGLANCPATCNADAGSAPDAG